MTRRAAYELVHDILCVLNDGKSRKTRLMYKSNTNPDVLKRYLKDLIKRELIVHHPPYYQITLSGENLLMHLGQVKYVLR